MNIDSIPALLDENAPAHLIEKLHVDARRLTDEVFGRDVFVRGLIEITNVCRNNCFYCGIRKDRKSVDRYTLSQQEIVSACEEAHRAGLRTFVLQGGENPDFSADYIAGIIKEIAQRFPEAAITLSLGEWEDEDYELFRNSGATRYLLRHETYPAEHYARLHPRTMSRNNRLRCLHTLKRLGFETGTGIMVGSPFQTIDHIVADIEFMLSLQPEMIGIGSFIPAADTPFSKFPTGSVDRTLRLISILRLLFPHANIPATTALATLNPEHGRMAALNAGANVVMPNISPLAVRKAYNLYDNKAASGLEAFEQLDVLAATFVAEGFRLSLDRGDFKPIKK